MPAETSLPQSITKRFELLQHTDGTSCYQGGQSRVYRARDRFNGVYVAIKLANPNKNFGSDETQQRLTTEIELLEKLDHPGIVRLYARPKDTKTASYFVMPWIVGMTLRAAIVRPPVDPLPLLAIVQQALTSLQYLHTQQILHRDIKPDNLIYDTYHQQLVLIDLGIAKPARPNPSAHSNKKPLGTLGYQAPEIAQGNPHTRESDIWAMTKTLIDLIDAQKTQNDLHNELKKILEPALKSRCAISDLIQQLSSTAASAPQPTRDNSTPDSWPLQTKREIHQNTKTLPERLTEHRIAPIQPTDSNLEHHLERLKTELCLPREHETAGIKFRLMPFTQDSSNVKCWPFYASQTPITTQQFCSITGTQPIRDNYTTQHWNNDSKPADNISLDACLKFCQLIEPQSPELRKNPGIIGLLALPTPAQIEVILRCSPPKAAGRTRHYTYQPKDAGQHQYQQTYEYIHDRNVKTHDRNVKITRLQHKRETVIDNAVFHLILNPEFGKLT